MGKLKIHYSYTAEDSPEGASYCTPNKVRKQITTDPEKVTCKICQMWSMPDAEENEQLKTQIERHWSHSVFSLNRDRKAHHVFISLLGIIDSLITILTFGTVLSSIEINYLFYNLGRQCDKAKKEEERKADSE